MKKEAACELRAKHGLYASLLFGFLAVATVVFSTFDQRLNPSLQAAFLCVILVFGSLVAVPRLFIVEADQGTFDLLRTLIPPGAAYAGKLLFAVFQLWVLAILTGAIFLVMSNAEVAHPLFLIMAVLLFTAGIAGALSLCSALVIGATNRWVLAGVIAMPLLFPMIFMGVGAVRYGFGSGTLQAGQSNLMAMLAYSVLMLVAGPLVIESVWDDRGDPVASKTAPQNGERS